MGDPRRGHWVAINGHQRPPGGKVCALPPQHGHYMAVDLLLVFLISAQPHGVPGVAARAGDLNPMYPPCPWRCRCYWIGRRTCHCSKWWWVCEKIFVPAQADAFRRRNGQVSASRFFLWVCLADLVAVLWHAGQLVLSGEQAGGLRGCRWLCGPAGLGTRNCTGECAVRRWASWCAVRACLATRSWTRECADGPAGGWHCSSRRWQIADGRRRGARGQVVAGGGIGTH